MYKDNKIQILDKNGNVRAQCAGELHLLTLKKCPDYLTKNYRNLALNVWDQHGLTTCYPHATANVETRGEAVFAAQNAIDGVTVNKSHGEWPYASWGINMQDDAQITIDFGRTVVIDRLVMYTRADFPHDNWRFTGTKPEKSSKKHGKRRLRTFFMFFCE